MKILLIMLIAYLCFIAYIMVDMYFFFPKKIKKQLDEMVAEFESKLNKTKEIE